MIFPINRWPWCFILALMHSALLGAGFSDRVWLSREHADLRVVYEAGATNPLTLMVRDGVGGTNYASTNVVLVVREVAATPIPEGFEQFGDVGSPLWILPASQDPGLLYLGISGEGLPRGTFEEPLDLRLRDVQAAGWFFLWQFNPDGTLNLQMDSRQGIGPEDLVHPAVGGHGHYNWGFSSNGWYEVTFQLEGRLLGAATNLPSSPVTFVFAVEPLPPEPAPPAVLSDLFLSDAQIHCRLQGEPGVSYRLETSTDLLHWSPRTVVVAETQPIPIFIPIPSDGAPLFLRASSP